ncbi:MAG: hypothetical protein ACLQVY_25035, partial [Limisphaerales bacterium]
MNAFIFPLCARETFKTTWKSWFEKANRTHLFIFVNAKRRGIWKESAPASAPGRHCDGGTAFEIFQWW